MKFQKLILLNIVVLILACKSKSDYLDNCNCNKPSFKEGVEISDNFNRYTIKFPNKDWEPFAHNNEWGLGIVGALIDGESFKSFGVIELQKENNWKNFEQQQAEIVAKYNVVESGLTEINGMKSFWNLVDFKNDSIPMLTLYITTEHPTENLFYTLSLSVSKDKYGKKELCELEDLLKTFNTK
jgi:hypothetical protein